MSRPYLFSKEEDIDEVSVYTFSSVNGAVYVVSFDPTQYDKYIEDYPNLFQKGYGFSFSNITRPVQINKHDPRIGVTIGEIMKNFILSNGGDTVLIYHCDFNDKKQACRNKVFNDWYIASPHKNIIFKSGLEIEAQDKSEKYFIGYITLHNNPNADAIAVEFDAVSLNIIQDK